MEGDKELGVEDCQSNPLNYVKNLVKNGELFQRFISSKVLPVDRPTTWFMAGSPGAGKTETAKTLLLILLKMAYLLLGLTLTKLGLSVLAIMGTMLIYSNKLFLGVFASYIIVPTSSSLMFC